MEGSESKINLDYYFNIFSEKLDEFEFINKDLDKMSLILPDMYNFDFGNLDFLETILEGVIGTYAEASLHEVLELFGSNHNFKPINPLANFVEHIYLIPVTDWLVYREKEILGYSLTRMPFSNTEPLHQILFEPVLDYVNSNIDGWISNSISEGMEKIQKTYGVL